MAERSRTITGFLDGCGWGAADRAMLAGDASFRRYERLTMPDGRVAVLMDAPPPQEDVRPFRRIADILTGLDLSAPRVLAADDAAGLLLLEDLGDDTYNRVIAAKPALETPLYELATDALIALHRRFRPADHAGIPRLDDARALVEGERLLDWTWPALKGGGAPEGVRADFRAALAAGLPAMRAVPDTLALFDYHQDNLLWLPDRAGPAACGLLDFQDAVLAPVPFDLMSLIQDVRRVVPADLGRALVDRYLAAFPDLDADGFHAAYAVAGAQRNIRILGTFVRLAHRDGKPTYLGWMDRTWAIVEENLAHPALSDLRRWFDHHLPADLRRRAIDPARLVTTE